MKRKIERREKNILIPINMCVCVCVCFQSQAVEGGQDRKGKHL